MRGRKDTAAAEHHYFPKALQKYWKDDAGWVHRLSVSGKHDRSKNGTFGHLRNAHHIKLSDRPTLWDESFEYTFRPADSAIPTVIEALTPAEAPVGVEEREWRERLAPQWYLNERRSEIAELLASLVVRSPNMRNLIRLTVEDFWPEKPPWPSGSAPNHLIAGNQKPLLEQYSKALATRGKYAILLTDHREFVFGDGMLHNFHSGGAVSPHNPRCLVPLTPTLAVAYNCPSQYHVSADFVAIRLSPEEVDYVNFCTQIYSGRHLFYRSQLPSDLTPFRVGKYQQLEYHRAPWFDELMNTIANTWF